MSKRTTRRLSLPPKLVLLYAAIHVAAFSQHLTKEYVYVGDRLVAVELEPGVSTADLEVASLSSASQGVSGGNLQVTFAYSNSGPATAQATRVAFYFSASPNNAIETTDPASPTTYTIPAGFTGASSSINLTIQIPTLSNGDYFLGAYIDDQNLVAESDDADNTRLSATGGAPGAFTIVPPGPLSPTVISLSPTSDSGSIQVFEGVFRDGNGYSDLASARMLINGSQVATNACYVQYAAGSGFALRNNGNTAWIDAGTSALVGNGQCLLDAAASSASEVNGDLVVEWEVTFTGGFSGSKNVWLEATDLSSNSVSSPVLGSWTVPLPNLSLSNPSLPGGTSPTEGEEFDVSVQVNNAGAQILQTVQVGFYLTSQGVSTPPAPNPANRIGSCGVSLPNGFPADGSATCQGVAIAPSDGAFRIWAIADDATAISESNEANNAIQVADINVQAAAPATNSDLRVTFLSVSPSSIAQGGLGSFNVTFNNQGTTSTGTGFNIGLYFSTDATITISDAQVSGCTWSGGLGAGQTVSCPGTSFSTANIAAGTYYVGAMVDNGGVIAETNETNNWRTADSGQVAITVGSGSGPNVIHRITSSPAEAQPGQSFSYTVSNTNAGNQVAQVPFTADLYLSTSYLYSSIGSATYLGTCSNFAPPSPLNPLGTPPFQATCGRSVALPAGLTPGAYYLISNLNYWNGGQDTDKANNFDTEPIYIDVPIAPEPISVSPSSGSGSSQVFTILVEDDNGASDIVDVTWLVNGSLAFAGSCSVWYWQSGNQLRIINDDGTAWQAAAITLGSGSLTNSSCTINGAGSSASSVGNQLQLTLQVTFASGLGSTQSQWVAAADSTAGSPWVDLGEWTLPGPPNNPPAGTSVAPTSGAGVSRLFTLRYSDADGAADIVNASVLFGSTLASTNACWARLDQVANRVHLLNDSATDWGAGGNIGADTTLQNSACRLSLAGAGVSTSGNEFVWTLPVQFLSAFVGIKNTYLSALDASGQGQPWAALGAWNVSVVSQPQNAGFELTWPSGWNTHWSSTTVSYSTSIKRSGARSLAVSVSSGPGGGVNQDISGLVAGALYEVSGWVRVSAGATGQVSLWLHDTLGGNEVRDVVTVSSSSFQYIKAIFQANSTNKVRIHLQFEGNPPGGTMYWDDIAIQFADPPQPHNAGFEDPLLGAWNVHWSSTAVNYSTTVKRSGAQALAVSVSSGPGGGVNQDIPGLVQGASYLVSGWVRVSSGATGQVSLWLHDTLGGNEIRNAVTVSNSTFQYITAVFQANSTKKVRIHLQFEGNPPGGTMYWDDISIFKLTP